MYTLDDDDKVYEYEIDGFVPGSWETAYQSIATRAIKMRTDMFEEWNRNFKDDRKKRFGL